LPTVRLDLPIILPTAVNIKFVLVVRACLKALPRAFPKKWVKQNLN
jgi:hypothetical protein